MSPAGDGGAEVAAQRLSSAHWLTDLKSLFTFGFTFPEVVMQPVALDAAAGPGLAVFTLCALVVAAAVVLGAVGGYNSCRKESGFDHCKKELHLSTKSFLFSSTGSVYQLPSSPKSQFLPS